MNITKISWATHTLNWVHGCSKPAAAPPAAFALPPEVFADLYPDGVPEKWTKPNTSPECIRCYAEALSNRRGWTPKPWLECNAPENVQLHPERFKEIRKLPLKSVTLPPSERQRVFICSMGDWAHELVPDTLIHQLFENMAATPHIFQLLTKRPDRAAALDVDWPENVWLGTTCGHPITKWRVEYLRRSRAKTRFISMEPLLDSMLPLNLDGIHQVIVGGESGTGYRPMRMEWAREMRDLCAASGVAYFHKQGSAFRTERQTYLVEQDGRCLEYRQFPGELTQPVLVEPDNLAKHREQFPIVA